MGQTMSSIKKVFVSEVHLETSRNVSDKQYKNTNAVG